MNNIHHLHDLDRARKVADLKAKGDAAWTEAETIYQVIHSLNRRLDQLKLQALTAWAEADAIERK
jgi:hypothetical protein